MVAFLVVGFALLGATQATAQVQRLETQRLQDAAWLQRDGFTPTGGLYGDRIIASGPWLVVQSYGEVHPRSPVRNSGVAYVYRRAPAEFTWQQLVASPWPVNYLTWSLLAVGPTDILFGDPLHGETVALAGRVQVFEEVGGTWMYSQYLESPRPLGGGFFGALAVTDGDDLLVGGNDPSATAPGGVELVYFHFIRTPIGWEYSGNDIRVPQSLGGFTFGSGRLCGDLFVCQVVFPGSSTASRRNGVAIFRRQQGWFEFEAVLFRPDPIPGGQDQFGHTGLDLDGDWIAVGSNPLTPFASPQPGRVYLYQNQPSGSSNWNLMQVLLAPNAPTSPPEVDEFGEFVEIEGDRLVVTASLSRYGPQNQMLGEAFLFEHGSGGWQVTERFATESILSGALSGNPVRLATRCTFDDGVLALTQLGDFLPETGSPYAAVYVYELGLGTALCAPPSGPTLEVTGAANLRLGALTARLEGVPSNSVGVVLASHATGPGHGTQPNTLGLCLGQSARRLAVWAAPVGSGPLALPLALPAGVAQAGERWLFQALHSSASTTQASGVSNAVLLTFNP